MGPTHWQSDLPELRLSPGNLADIGETWKIIAFDTGAYELAAINYEIKRQLTANRHSKSAISITANISRLTSIVNIKNLFYKGNFDVENSIGSFLGFRAVVISSGYNESSNILDIMQINSILVNIDLIMGSYVNSSPSPAIFCLNILPGYKIVEEPIPSLIYYPVSRHDISRMKVWLTDRNGNLVDLR